MIHKSVDKTVKNPTKSSKNIINAVYDEIWSEPCKSVKPCSLVEIKTVNRDFIDIKNNSKPEIDLLGIVYKCSEFVECFPKLTETRNFEKPHKHIYLELIKILYPN